VAEALEARGAPPAVLAYHWDLAAGSDSALRAAGHHYTAGLQALVQLAPEEALAHSERALAALDRGAHRGVLRCDVLLLAARVQHRMLDTGAGDTAAWDAVAEAEASGDLERCTAAIELLTAHLPEGVPNELLQRQCAVTLTWARAPVADEHLVGRLSAAQAAIALAAGDNE